MKVVFLLTALSLASIASANTSLTRITDEGVVCTLMIAEKTSPQANLFQGLRLYKDNKFVREMGIRNNVGQFPAELQLSSKCDILALYPVYDGRFQNLFINGKWVKDLPVPE